MQKYDFDEARPILERASARETAARVALGRVASNFLEQSVGARIVSHVIELGGVRAPDGLWPEPDDVTRLDEDPVRCLDPDTSKQMVARIDQAHDDGDTLGGVVEVVVHGLPPGPRLARALGPPPRLAARRCADGHPGDQGRRGRRRLRARRHAGLPGPRRDGADRRRHPSAQRPLRRHRGRHDHRRGAAGPRGDEADRDRAPRAAAPSTSPPARRRSPTTSAPTCAPSRPPASSPRRWSRSSWPTPSWRSSAATRCRRRPATPQSYLDTLRFK